MAKYTEQERRGRLALDHEICTEMARRCNTLELEAYRSAEDLGARRNRIVDPGGGHEARHYLATYNIRTLVGPGKFADTTLIHVDVLANGNYPFTPPASWVLSQIPYSPHFRSGMVVCIGQIWDKNGKTLLAHILRHHARLLNWHEVSRGEGYRGWNAAAIAYHQKHYGTKPLTEGLIYPELPEDLAYGVQSTAQFEMTGRRPAAYSQADADESLFDLPVAR